MVFSVSAGDDWRALYVNDIIHHINGATYYGGETTASSTPDMNVSVASGQFRINNISFLTSDTTLSISAADATNPRKDVIVVKEIEPPTSATATLASGGSLADATYYYVITAVNSQGESATSNETYGVTTDSDAGNSTINLSWTASDDATSYNIYRTTTSDSYGTSTLLASGVTATSYTDDGSVSLSAGQPSHYAMGYYKVLTGTAASNPTPPAITSDEIPVALIDVPTNDTSIEQSQITDLRIELEHSLELNFNSIDYSSTVTSYTNNFLNEYAYKIDANSTYITKSNSTYEESASIDNKSAFGILAGGTTKFYNLADSSNNCNLRALNGNNNKYINSDAISIDASIDNKLILDNTPANDVILKSGRKDLAYGIATSNPSGNTQLTDHDSIHSYVAIWGVYDTETTVWELDLGASKTISRIFHKTYFYNIGDGDTLHIYLKYSTDDSTWTTLNDYSSTTAHTMYYYNILSSSITARYWKLSAVENNTHSTVVKSYIFSIFE